MYIKKGDLFHYHICTYIGLYTLFFLFLLHHAFEILNEVKCLKAEYDSLCFFAESQ